MRGNHDGYESVRALILDTAAMLFTQTGVHGTSLNDIASAANLSKGTIYYYYPAKESLVLDIAQIHCESMNDILLNWMRELQRDDPMDAALSKLIDTILFGDERQRKLHTVLLVECRLGESHLSEIIRAQTEKWAVMLEVGALKIQTADSRKLRERSQLFFTLLHGYMLKENISPTDKDEFIGLMLV